MVLLTVAFGIRWRKKRRNSVALFCKFDSCPGHFCQLLWSSPDPGLCHKLYKNRYIAREFQNTRGKIDLDSMAHVGGNFANSCPQEHLNFSELPPAVLTLLRSNRSSLRSDVSGSSTAAVCIWRSRQQAGGGGDSNIDLSERKSGSPWASIESTLARNARGDVGTARNTAEMLPWVYGRAGHWPREAKHEPGASRLKLDAEP